MSDQPRPEGQSEQTEQQGEQETAPKQEVPKAPPQRRAFGRGFIIAVIVAVVVGGLIAYFLPNIKAFVNLQPWSKTGPRELVSRFAAALESRDAAALRAILPAQGGLQVTEENGKLVAIKPAQAMMMPPIPVELVIPSGSAANAPVKYHFSELNPHAEITLPVASGGGMTILAARQGGVWVFAGFSLKDVPLPAPAAKSKAPAKSPE